MLNIAMFVSVTRLRVRSKLFLPRFLWLTMRIRRQTERADGFLGGELLVDSKLTFWTLTTWDGDKSMKRYRGSGPHSIAMSKLPVWCDEAAYTHWTEGAARIPGWEEAFVRFAHSPKLSRVDHPSPEHQRGEFQAMNLNTRLRRKITPIRNRATA